MNSPSKQDIETLKEIQRLGREIIKALGHDIKIGCENKEVEEAYEESKKATQATATK